MPVGRKPQTARAGYDPFSDVKRAQDLTREGVEAFGEQLRPQFEQQVGDVLGGLNSIGALRSGGTQVAMNDLSRTFADQIGSHASSATLQAIGHGLQASSARQQNRMISNQEDEQRRQRRGALLGSIGSVLGAGLGMIAGPALGAVGTKIGNKITGGA